MATERIDLFNDDLSRSTPVKRSEAKSLAWKLREEGKKAPEIVKALAAAGFKGSRGPLGVGGVYYLMGGIRKPRRKTAERAEPLMAAATKVPKRAMDERIQLIRAICAQETMKATDRIAAILLLT